MIKEYAVSAKVHTGPTSSRAPTSSTSTHAPTPSTVFTQKNCWDSSCNVWCEDTSYPTDTCIHVDDRHAILTCTNDEIIQTVYDDATCSGKGEKSSMPLNKCLQSYLGYFENRCGSSTSLQSTTDFTSMWSTEHPLGQPRNHQEEEAAPRPGKKDKKGKKNDGKKKGKKHPKGKKGGRRH
ncbi:cruzipain [Angomonas deanei]|uniref:DUF3586 domain-containing protein n=1 Tax=Angomonas deanei TaxID=59799 RepID=A0A7G2CCS2_9TRYP|nr:cruzipain [Angomonas deanei]CAD2217620.1 Protein of unknown function (DUF3586), putative [Angomonas deanei]|eukprot:EPY21577.1 cruzipain [Angomonas deanei]